MTTTTIEELRLIEGNELGAKLLEEVSMRMSGGPFAAYKITGDEGDTDVVFAYLTNTGLRWVRP